MAAWWETTFSQPQAEKPWWETAFGLPEEVFTAERPAVGLTMDITPEQIKNPTPPEPSPYIRELPPDVDPSQLDVSSFGSVPRFYRPESLSDADPERAAEQFAKPPRAGLMETAGMLGGQIYDAAAYHLPGAFAASLEGSDPYAERDWKDALVERSRERAEERQPYFGNRETALGFADERDIAGLGPSLGFSAVGMGAGLGAGVGTTAALAPVSGPAALVGGYLAGGAASFESARRMSTNAFVRDLRDAVDQERAEANQPPISDEEFNARREALEPLITEYGLWEAVPEAVSNVAGFGILKAPIKSAVGRIFGKNILTRLATKTASVFGTELATETATGMGQHNVNVGVGLMDGPRRSWTNWDDLGETFSEVAPATILQTALLAGGTKAGMMLQDRIQRGNLTREQYDLMMEFNNQVERGQINPEAARKAALETLDPLANQSHQLRYTEQPSGGILPGFDAAFNQAARDIDDAETLFEQEETQQWGPNTFDWAGGAIPTMPEIQPMASTESAPWAIENQEVPRETLETLSDTLPSAMGQNQAFAPLMGGVVPLQTAPKRAVADTGAIDPDRMTDEEFDQWYTSTEREAMQPLMDARKSSTQGRAWRTEYNPAKDGFLEMLAKRGGLDADAFEREGFDVKGLKERKDGFNNNRIPGSPIIRGKGKGGLKPDDVAEIISGLVQDGTMVVPQDILDEHGRTTVNDVLEVLTQEINGTPVIFSQLKADIDQQEARVRRQLEEARYRRENFAEIQEIESQDTSLLADMESIPTHEKEFYNPEWDSKTRTLADWMDDAIDEGVSDQEIESVLTDDMPVPERVLAINQLIEAKRDERFNERLEAAFKSRNPGPLPTEAQRRPQAETPRPQELEQGSAQAQVTGSDLLGQDTSKQQALGDRARAKEEQRSGKPGTETVPVEAGAGELFAGQQPAGLFEQQVKKDRVIRIETTEGPDEMSESEARRRLAENLTDDAIHELDAHERALAEAERDAIKAELEKVDNATVQSAAPAPSETQTQILSKQQWSAAIAKAESEWTRFDLGQRDYFRSRAGFKGKENAWINKTEWADLTLSIQREFGKRYLPDTPAPTVTKSETALPDQPKTAPNARFIEKREAIHEKGSTQINLPERHASRVVAFGKSIPDSEVYVDPEDSTIGREKDPHVTVLYGINGNDHTAPAKALEGAGPITFTLGETKVFENEKYDVLVVEVKSDSLAAANKALRDSVEYENDFPDYKPHVTIAYLKKGEGKKYAGRNDLSGIKVSASEVQFSAASGERYAIDTAAPKPAQARSAAPATDKISDFGEKIGGARKDTSSPTGSRGQSVKDDRPAWRKRYAVTEVLTDKSNPDAIGKFSIYDNKTERFVREGYKDKVYDTAEEAEAAIPLYEVARNHSVYQERMAKDGEKGTYGIYRKVSDKKRPLLKGGFETREDALRYMVENAVEIIETKMRIDDSIHPALEKVVREGVERRPADKDVNAKDFSDTFGFRGVEFGLWNNSAERQYILNQAYDALLDLAEILDVPPRAISLNGELGIGFGSRGHGLLGAKAHYERDYAAINITKIKGAGSLAHEWLHAFDHYLGRQAGKASAEKIKNASGDMVFKAGGKPELDYVSHGFGWKAKERTREELRTAFDRVIEAISKREIEFTEDRSTRERIESKQQARLDEVLDKFRVEMARDHTNTTYKYYRGKKNEPATPAQLAKIDGIISDIKAGNYGEVVTDDSAKVRYSFHEKALELSRLHKEIRGRQGFGRGSDGKLWGVIADIHFAIQSQKEADKFLREAKEEKVKTKKVRTEYYSEAWKLDQGTVKDYWSTPHELAARAFEAYIYDQMKNLDARNDFLAYEKHNNLPEYRMFNLKPYPEGAERAAINKAWKELFEIVESKETEQGIVLFSRLASTKDTYEKRIDDLWNDASPRRDLLHVLDRSDVLDMMGLSEKPLVVLESKISKTFDKHNLTNEHWKKIPEWVENPLAVFESESEPGTLVFVSPESVGGLPIVVVIKPNADYLEASLLVTAFDKAGKGYLQKWANDGLLRYIQTKEKPLTSGTEQLQWLKVNTHLGKGSASNVLTERDLVKYRASRSDVSAEFDRTEAINFGYGRKSAPATRRAEKGQQTFLTRALERAMARFTGNPVEAGTYTQVESPKRHAASVKAVERVFGRRVVFFRANKPTGFWFNGVVLLPSDPKTMYVNIDSQNPFMGVVGHELLHTLRQEHPELYDRLAKMARARLKSTGFADFAKELDKKISENRGDKRLSDDAMFEEMVANVVGDAFLDPAFVAELRQMDQNFLQRLVDALVEILRSIQSRLNTRGMGSSQYFNDVESLITQTQAVLRAHVRPAAKAAKAPAKSRALTEAPAFQSVYHGSPHKWDLVDLSKVGTGEGAQAFGWGFYAAESKGIAEDYKKQLSRESTYSVRGISAAESPGDLKRKFTTGRPTKNDLNQFAATVAQYRGGLPFDSRDRTAGALIAQARLWWGMGVSLATEDKIDDYARDLKQSDVVSERGHLYELDLPDPVIERMLDWDKPLSEQPEHVKAALKSVPQDVLESSKRQAKYPTGNTLYYELQNRALSYDDNPLNRLFKSSGHGNQQRVASEYLNSIGIPGIKYLDGTSRKDGDGTRNFVVFDAKHLKTLTRNGEPITLPEIEEAKTDAEDQEPKFHRSQGTPGWVPRVKPLTEVLKSRWNYWMRAQGNLPDVVFAEKIKRDNSMGADELHIRHKMADFDRAVRLSYGKSYSKLTAAEKETLNDYLAGVSVTIPAGVKKAMIPMRDYLDRLSDEMISEGVVQNQDTIDKILNNIGQYLNRSYQAFDDPDWPRKVPDSVRRAAYRHIEDRLRQDGKLTGLTTAQIEDKVSGQIENILQEGTAADNIGALVSESKLGSKDLSMLIQRKEIPKPIRDLLGEYRDARVNFVRSATKMERAIMNHVFLEGVKANGHNVFLFDEPTGEYSVRIASDASSPMAPLNGLYTTPEIKKAFTDALDKEQMANWWRWTIGINGFIKYGKTVLSVTTISRNFLSASFFGVANGHFALFNPKATKTAFQTIQRELRSVDGSRDYAKKMKALGVIYDNPYAGEMIGVLKDFTDSETSYIEGSIKGGARKFFDVMTRIYQAGDDFWKILGFEIEAANLEKHGGMTRQAAEREAAERIRNTYPTYSMIGKAVRWLRRFPLVGTFVSFPAEIVRTSVNIVRYAAKDAKTPGMKVVAAQKIVGIAMAAGLAAAARSISMAIMGFDDDDDEAVRMMGPPWSKNSDLFYVGYDENGLPEYFDLSFLDPYNYLKRPLNALFRGKDDWQDRLKSAMTDMTSPFIGTDILAGAIGEIVYNQRETGGPVYNPDESNFEQFKAIFNHLRKAVQPGTFGNIERITDAVQGDVSRYGKQYKLADEVWAVGGFRKSTLNPLQSISFKAFEFAERSRNATQILSYPLGGQNKVSESEIESAFGRMIEARAETYQDMIDYVSAAESMNLPSSSIRSVLKASGVSKANITAIMRGRIPAWEPSDQFLDSAKARAMETAESSARKLELRKTFDERVRLVKKLAREEARRAWTNQSTPE